MKRTIIIISLSFYSLFVSAQTDVDALRNSHKTIVGSARTAALGGAAGALGADLLNFSINPAGLAQFRSNEWSAGLTYQMSGNESNYLGNISSEMRSGVNIPSVGVVFSNLYYDREGKLRQRGWVNVNWGMSYLRTGSFNRTIAFEGRNDQNSFTDHIAERSRGLSTFDFGGTDEDFVEGFNYLEDMFWWSYLIDSFGQGQYVGSYDPQFRDMYQRGLVVQEGRSNEWHLGLSANYSNKVYLGGSMRVVRSRYEERMEFQEVDDPATTWNFNQYTLDRQLSSRGTGFGINLGVMVLPTDNFRAGISLQTPTVLSLTDEYSDQLNTIMDDGEQFQYRTRDSRFEYELSSPMRTTVSAAYLFDKRGLISADVEFVDYANMRLNPESSGFGSYFATQNNTINNKYDQSVNLRLGGEWRVEQLRFRAGYANQGSPFRDNPEYRSSRFSAGFGIRERRTALDIAFVHSRIRDIYFPYQLNDGSAAGAKNLWTDNGLILSVSSKF